MIHNMGVSVAFRCLGYRKDDRKSQHGILVCLLPGCLENETKRKQPNKHGILIVVVVVVVFSGFDLVWDSTWGPKKKKRIRMPSRNMAHVKARVSMPPDGSLSACLFACRRE